jgi:hypothetical protein
MILYTMTVIPEKLKKFIVKLYLELLDVRLPSDIENFEVDSFFNHGPVAASATISTPNVLIPELVLEQALSGTSEDSSHC